MKRWVGWIVVGALALLVIWLENGAERARRGRASAATEAPAAPPAKPADVALAESVPIVAPSQADEQRRTPVQARTAQAAAPRVVPAAGGARLAVRVVSADPARRTLSQVRVRVLHASADQPGSFGGSGESVTDPSGRTEVAVPPDVPLEVLAQGQDVTVGAVQQRCTPLRAGERREIVVALPVEDLRFVGCVLDAESERPVAGAIVEESDESGQRKTFALSDAAGYFELAVGTPAVPDRVQLAIEAEGFGVACGDVVPGHETRERAQLFRVWAAASLDGCVTDGNRQPRPGIAVSATAPRSEWMPRFRGEDPEWHATTDAAGRFRWTDLPPRVVIHLALARIDDDPAPVRTDVSLAPGERRELDLVLNERVDLRVHVVDDAGAPVALELRAEPAPDRRPALFDGFEPAGTRTIRTGADGCGEIEQLEPGPWRIGPAVRAGAPDSDIVVPAELEVDPAEDGCAAFGTLFEVATRPAQQSVELRVQRGRYLRGTVVDPSGSAIGGASVSAQLASIPGSIGATSRADGSFVLGPLLDETYRVGASCESFADSAEIDARPGERVRLRLEPAVAAGSIRGRVVFHGAPVHTVFVTAIRREDSVHSDAEPNGKGRFDLEGLPAGHYDVLAGNPTLFGRVLDVALDGGTQSVTIELQEGATLRLVHLGAEPGANVVAWLGATRAACRTVAAGSSSLFCVPAGHLRIEVSPLSGATVGAVGLEPENVGAPATTWSREVDGLPGREIVVVYP